MQHGVAMKHGGRTRVDFHPLGQGRDVCDVEKDLHRLPSCVLWARACALTCQTVGSVNPWSCYHRPRDAPS